MSQQAQAKSPNDVLGEAVVAAIEAARERYPTAQAVILPALWAVQKAHGWISSERAQAVAELLDVPRAWIDEVLSFYVLFHTEPVGEHVIWLCRNISCVLRGYEEIRAHLEARLGIREGETTPDGRFTLLSNECLGACGGAPMMQVDDRYYEHLTPERVDEILAELGGGAS